MNKGFWITALAFWLVGAILHMGFHFVHPALFYGIGYVGGFASIAVGLRVEEGRW